MALAALRGAIAAGRSGVSALTGSGHISAAAAVALQTRGLSSHSENTNVFIREVRLVSLCRGRIASRGVCSTTLTYGCVTLQALNELEYPAKLQVRHCSAECNVLPLAALGPC
jgi:hypothetical protein